MANVFWDDANGEHRRAFATIIAPLVAVLWKRKEDFGSVEARIYMKTLKSVPPAILAVAVDKALEFETWFPEPAKLLIYAADEIDTQRKEARDTWLTDCTECHGDRWVWVSNEAHRCGCWRRWLQALKEIGEPIKRPRLEAVNAVEP